MLEPKVVPAFVRPDLTNHHLPVIAKESKAPKVGRATFRGSGRLKPFLLLLNGLVPCAHIAFTILKINFVHSGLFYSLVGFWILVKNKDITFSH